MPAGFVVKIEVADTFDGPGETRWVKPVRRPWSREEAQRVARWELQRLGYDERFLAKSTYLYEDNGPDDLELCNPNGTTYAYATVLKVKWGTDRYGPVHHPVFMGAHPMMGVVA